MWSPDIQTGRNGTTLTDADTAQDEFQVAISRGLNTIKVKVTAGDSITTQTYTVTVNRPRVLVSNLSKSRSGALFIGNTAGTQTKQPRGSLPEAKPTDTNSTRSTSNSKHPAGTPCHW